MEVISWNLAGVDLVKLRLREVGRVFGLPFLSLQELPRGTTGWQTHHVGGWEVCACQPADMWRGIGIGFDPTRWALMRRKISGRGIWCRFRGLHLSVEIWVGTFHFTQGCSQDQHYAEVSTFLSGLPATTHPVVIAGDTNAAVQWSVDGEGITPFGGNGKSLNMLGAVQGAGYRFCQPSLQQLETPTSRPRKAGDRGHQIDLAACKHVAFDHLHIHVDSCFALGSDHDMVSVLFNLAREGRPFTRPRKVVAELPKVSEVNQQILEDLSQHFTKPAAGARYKDPPEVRSTRNRQVWKQALQARCKARGEWMAERMKWSFKTSCLRMGDWFCRAPGPP